MPVITMKGIMRLKLKIYNNQKKNTGGKYD